EYGQGRHLPPNDGAIRQFFHKQTKAQPVALRKVGVVLRALELYARGVYAASTSTSPAHAILRKTSELRTLKRHKCRAPAACAPLPALEACSAPSKPALGLALQP